MPANSPRSGDWGSAQGLHRATPRPLLCHAGKPRLVAKLHRPWPGGAVSPRGPTPLSFHGAPTLATPSAQIVDASCGPSAALRAVWTSHGEASLPHRLPTLGALASTASPLLQQRCIRKATAPAGSRNAPSSQEIRLRNNPVKSPGDSTREREKQHWFVIRRRHGLLTGRWAVRSHVDLFTPPVTTRCGQRSSRMMFPTSSTRPCQSGKTTVVEPSSSTMAGPRKLASGGSSARR